ncbi:elongation factor G family protein [Striga asiatica]|uniref:Elongation factor G family protein n=1 Tax=Striga asiatica TaxID=4170 RepID=A0A5A7P3Y4_STRAF|nr:elongation factor G family protein [Striga asiatica]
MNQFHQVQNDVVQQVRGLVQQANKAQSTSDLHRQATRDFESAVSAWRSAFCRLVKFQLDFIRSLHAWYRLTLIPINNEQQQQSKNNNNKDPISNSTEDIKIKKRTESSSKELEKKASSLRSIEKKYYHSYSMAGIGLSDDGPNGWAGLDARDPLADKKAELAVCQRRVEDELQRHAKAVEIFKYLKEIQKNDPAFRVGLNNETGQTIISGMGEAHLDGYVERMRREYKVDGIGQPHVIFREKITKHVQFNYEHKKQSQYGRVIGYMEPLDLGSLTKFEFSNMLVRQAIPSNFMPAIEKGFKEAANSGSLIGHPVENIRIVLTDGAADSVDSSEHAFKLTAINAFRECYKSAQPIIFEPVVFVELEFPTKFLSIMKDHIIKMKGTIIEEELKSRKCLILAKVSLNHMCCYSTALRSMIEGKCKVSMDYEEHSQVSEDVLRQLVNAYKAT